MPHSHAPSPLPTTRFQVLGAAAAAMQRTGTGGAHTCPPQVGSLLPERPRHPHSQIAISGSTLPSNTKGRGRHTHPCLVLSNFLGNSRQVGGSAAQNIPGARNWASWEQSRLGWTARAPRGCTSTWETSGARGGAYLSRGLPPLRSALPLLGTHPPSASSPLGEVWHFAPSPRNAPQPGA